MNEKHTDQNKKSDQTSSMRDDDLQNEKTQQNTAKHDSSEKAGE